MFYLSVRPSGLYVSVGLSVCLPVVKSKQFLVDDLSAMKVVKTNIMDASSACRSHFSYSICSDTFHDT